jgi:hypothetical protein
MNVCLNCGKEVKNKYCNVGCQNKHQNALKANKRFGEFENYTVTCFSCKKQFSVIERSNLFPKKEKYYCSRSCANKRICSEEHKTKTSKSLIAYYKNVERVSVVNVCEWCGIEFNKKRKRRFCSKFCASKYITKNLIKYSRKAGQASSQKQSESRRSKNEKYFAELCANKFQNVLMNVAMFNGWDADVIIKDYKIAVLWNGVWHYNKITKKHSVKQVENRDKIKISEIKKLGYEPYIIKDLGKYNKFFVEKEFEIFEKYIAESVLVSLRGS